MQPYEYLLCSTAKDLIKRPKKMLGALVIVFREMLEAGLIVGIVMAATKGVPSRGRWVALGVTTGVIGACVVAGFAGALSEAFEGVGQEVFNACVLSIAVIMLMWHNAWMAAHGREIAIEMRNIGAAVSEGVKPLTALSIVVALAVLREGSEVALFLYGILAGGTSPSSLAIGGILGIAGGAAFSALIYFGLLSIPSRYLFSVTGVLIALLAAGLAAQAVQFLASAGILTAFDETAWNTSWLLSEGSIMGRLLHTLIGYTERPSTMQVLVYCGALILMALLMRLARQSHHENTKSGSRSRSAIAAE